MSSPSITAEPVQVYYGVNEVADNPDISNFSFETVIPVVVFDGDRRAVRVRSTWIGLEEIRGHIAWLEERALEAEADLRYANDKLDVEAVRLHVAERAAQDANEVLRSLRSDQFALNTVVPLGDVDGSGNVWVRLRSTEEGVRLLLKQLSRLDERAVLAEAALASASERCRQFEKRAERADWTASELRSAEFEWADSIPVDEPGGDRVLVRVRGTEGGIGKIKARMEQLVFFNELLNRSLALASDRALEAEAKVAALEGDVEELHEALGGTTASAEAAELRVRDLQGTVETYARFARAMRHLDSVTEAA